MVTKRPRSDSFQTTGVQKSEGLGVQNTFSLINHEDNDDIVFLGGLGSNKTDMHVTANKRIVLPVKTRSTLISALAAQKPTDQPLSSINKQPTVIIEHRTVTKAKQVLSILSDSTSF